jgi:hypothetical protein
MLRYRFRRCRLSDDPFWTIDYTQPVSTKGFIKTKDGSELPMLDERHARATHMADGLWRLPFENFNQHANTCVNWSPPVSNHP